MARAEPAASTVAAYVDAVGDIADRWGRGEWLWFRGISDARFGLVPKLLRTHQQLTSDEETLILEYLYKHELYGPQHVGSVTSENDPFVIYARMQHYGLPTRLLDWSASPLVALFFALHQPGNPRAHIAHPDTDGAVWLMNPTHLNRHCHDTDAIATWRSSVVRNYLPRALRPEGKRGFKMREEPMAIELPLGNRRIAAQQGCFTVHGTRSDALDSFLPKDAHVARVLLPAKAKRRLFDELETLGFTEDFIYQDLEALTLRITRQHFVAAGETRAPKRKGTVKARRSQRSS